MKKRRKKLPKSIIKEAHELGKRLQRHKNRIRTPYALAFYIVKKRRGKNDRKKRRKK